MTKPTKEEMLKWFDDIVQSARGGLTEIPARGMFQYSQALHDAIRALVEKYGDGDRPTMMDPPLLTWDKPMTSKEAAHCLMTGGFIAVEFYRTEMQRLAISNATGQRRICEPIHGGD